jgi:hypothetical protein
MKLSPSTTISTGCGSGSAFGSAIAKADEMSIKVAKAWVVLYNMAAGYKKVVVELYNRSKDRIGWTGQRRKECRLNERARTIVRLNSRNEDTFAGIGNARKMRLLRKGTWHLAYPASGE